MPTVKSVISSTTPLLSFVGIPYLRSCGSIVCCSAPSGPSSGPSGSLNSCSATPPARAKPSWLKPFTAASTCASTGGGVVCWGGQGVGVGCEERTTRLKLRGLFHWRSPLGSGGVGLQIGSSLFHWPRIQLGVGRQRHQARVQSMPRNAVEVQTAPCPPWIGPEPTRFGCQAGFRPCARAQRPECIPALVRPRASQKNRARSWS
eukprot:362094-Chlamydomonas_euryale.AAC.8